MDQVQTLRDYSGWAIRAICREKLTATTTHLALDEEYWIALRHPAEVEAAGRTLLAKCDPTFAARPESEQSQLWREFRAYVRQAEGFYRGATVLPWKSSPLNYYYAFMNLAKAVAVVRGLMPPQQVQEPRRLHHGISARVLPGNPDEWRVTVQGADGVFAKLYGVSVGVALQNGTEFDCRRLLGYLRDVSWQLDESGNGDWKGWFPSKWVFLQSPTHWWDVLVLQRRLPLDRLPPTVSDAYHEISVHGTKEFAFKRLGLHAVQAQSYRFLERKVPVPSDSQNVAMELERLLRQSIPNCVYECPNDVNEGFAIGLPYSTPIGSIPINELTAVYAVMYFLSSIVRYHPDYMDKIAESVDAWLIESFAKAAPLTLLRYLTSSVLGYTLIISSS